MQRVSPTLLRLVKLALLGSAISIMAYAEVFLPFPHPLHGHGFAAMLWSVRLELCCSLLPMLIGFAVLYYNNHRLSSGINHLRFTDEELEEARQFVKQRWLNSVQIVVCIAVVILSLAELSTHKFAGNSPVILLLVVNPLNYLRTSLAKPPAKAVATHWHLAQPIHSDTWGQTS